jgi:hypothetical protein
MSTENRADIVFISGVMTGLTFAVLAWVAFAEWSAYAQWALAPRGGKEYWEQCLRVVAAASLLGSYLGCRFSLALLRRKFPGMRQPSRLPILLCLLAIAIGMYFPFGVLALTAYSDPPYALVPVVLGADLLAYFIARIHLNKPAALIPYRGGGQQF